MREIGLTISSFFLEKEIKKYVIFFFILLFLSDFLMKFMKFGSLNFYFRLGGVIKIIFEGFLIISIFKTGLKKIFIFPILLLVLFFTINHIIFFPDSIFNRNLLQEILRGDIYHLNKYIFIILFIAVLSTSSKKIEIVNIIVNIFLFVLYFNSIFILIGFFFEINYLKAFPYSSRFGYTGLFVKSGDAVLLYILAIIYQYTQYLKGKSILPVTYFLFIIILSGKKIGLLIFPLLYITHLCMYSRNKNFFRFLGLLIISLLIFFKELIINLFIKLFPFWVPLYEKNGFWSVVFSKRDLLIKNTFGFISENWSFLNFLFGGSNFSKLRVELDPIDLFIYFGLFGSAIYISFFTRQIILPIKNKIILSLLIGYVIIGMTYGIFLNNIMLIVCLYVFSIYYRYDYKLETKE